MRSAILWRGLHEIRWSARAIASGPAFSALVVGVLAAGLTCTIFVLAVINGLVIRPLPFSAPDELLHAGVRDETGGATLNPVTNVDLIEVRRHLAGVAEVAGAARSSINVSDSDRAERVNGAFVSANLFRVLGVAPILGRDFSGEDERAGAAPMAMLSYELWQSRYGGDPSIVGRLIRVNALPTTVVGVMPRNFSFPRREVLWLPGPVAQGARNDGRYYWLILRRQAGSGEASITAQLNNWFAQSTHAEPDRFRGLRPGIEPLARMAVDGTTRSLLKIMLGAVAGVLLLACANAANLLFARALSRRQEFAVRVALGAGRKHLILPALIESVLLSVTATAVALLLAYLCIRWQYTLLRDADFGPPLWLRVEIDATVVLVALGAALFTALACGLLPALRAADAVVAERLRDGTRSVTGSSFARISRFLVIGQVALSCALLIGVGTMLRGIWAIDRLDIGIDTKHLLTGRIVLSTDAFPAGADQLQLYERLADRLRADPGVVDATVGTVLPGTWFNETRDVLPASTATPGDGALPHANYGAVDDHFLAAYGVVLQEGRFFDSRDLATGERVAVVDRRFVERFGGNQPILGRQFRIDPRDPNGATVAAVGVIGNLNLYAPGADRQPAMLIPLRQGPFRVASIAVRTRGDAPAFAPQLNEIMRNVDPDTPVYWIRDYAAVIGSVTFSERFVAQSFTLFGLIALVLAGAGLYGVMAFGVGQRTQEIGVRRALGAQSGNVLSQLFARSFVQFGIGIALGASVGIPLANLLTASMHSIEAGGVTVVLLTIAVLFVAALMAVAIPARRALHVDPVVALRHE